MSKWKIGNCEALKNLLYGFLQWTAFDEPKTNSIENALDASRRYQVPKIFPLLILSTLYILERVAAQNLYAFLTVFRNNDIMLQTY